MPSTDSHPFAQGDIVVSAWGRDQDNIDFYQVVRSTPKTVVIRRTKSRATEVIGPARALIVPIPDSFYSEGQRRRVVHDQGIWSIYVSSWERATRWDGAPRLSTRYV